MKSGVKQAILDGSGTVIGAMIMAFGISLFLLPNQLSTGGFSGIATITYYLFNIPMGLMNLILNIPMFIFSNYIISPYFCTEKIRILCRIKGPEGPRNILKCYKHRTEAIVVTAITIMTMEREQPGTGTIPQRAPTYRKRIVQRWKVRVVSLP